MQSEIQQIWKSFSGRLVTVLNQKSHESLANVAMHSRHDWTKRKLQQLTQSWLLTSFLTVSDSSHMLCWLRFLCCPTANDSFSIFYFDAASGRGLFRTIREEECCDQQVKQGPFFFLVNWHQRKWKNCVHISWNISCSLRRVRSRAFLVREILQNMFQSYIMVSQTARKSIQIMITFLLCENFL